MPQSRDLHDKVTTLPKKTARNLDCPSSGFTIIFHDFGRFHFETSAKTQFLITRTVLICNPFGPLRVQQRNAVGAEGVAI